MGIRRWHYGKIIMLWAWGAVLVFISIQVLNALDQRRYVFGTFVIIATLAVPLALSVITWSWLSGRERPND